MEYLAYGDVLSTLFRSIPEAKAAYDAWDMPGDPLPYIVFGFLEESFLTPAVDSGRNAELLTRIFAFLELMACSPDTEVINLLYVGLFEAWVSRPSTLKKGFRNMGPATRALISDAAHGHQCGHNLPNA